MIHNDHLGTPQKLTDSTGTVVWSADYKPFGEATVNPSSTITNNLRFPGQYYDAETGLNYNYYRDYNPVTGRYLQADQMGIQEGTNHLFVYVGNNPTDFADPFGLGYNDLPPNLQLPPDYPLPPNFWPPPSPTPSPPDWKPPMPDIPNWLKTQCTPWKKVGCLQCRTCVKPKVKFSLKPPYISQYSVHASSL
jgi:RHS repeat-associated protein